MIGYSVVRGARRVTELARAIDEGRLHMSPKVPTRSPDDPRLAARSTHLSADSGAPSTRSLAAARDLSLVAAATTVASIAYVVHQLGGGLGRQISAWFAALAITSVLTVGIVRGPRRRHWRTPVALSLAVLLFLAKNVETLKTSADAKRAIEVLATVSGPDDVRAKLAANEGNGFLDLVKVASETSEDAAREFSSLTLNLAPPELAGPFTLETASVEELREHYRHLRNAQENALTAPSEVAFILQRQRSRVSAYLEKSRLDAATRSVALDEMAKIQGELGSYLKEFFSLKAREFELSSQLVALLIREGEAVFLDPADGTWTFQSESALHAFNQVVGELQANEQRLAAHLERGEEIDARYKAGFEQGLASR